MNNLKIIAELAQGYEGKFEQAIQLIKSAKLGLADYAKIQIVFADELATQDYKDYKIFKSLEMSKKKWLKIFKFSKKINIELITEIFGKKSLEVAKFIKSKNFKLHPTDINNFELIELIKKSKPEKVFIGIGGATKREISLCLNSFKNYEIILLHGHQTLPTPNNDLNISRIKKILEDFNKNELKKLSLGIADHVLPGDKDQDIIVSMAIGAGVEYIEKHLTINRVLELEDYYSALNPDELKKFVLSVKRMISIFGESNYKIKRSEKVYKKNISRHVVAKKTFRANELIEKKYITMKRTSFNQALNTFESVIGKKTRVPLKKGAVLLEKHLK